MMLDTAPPRGLDWPPTALEVAWYEALRRGERDAFDAASAALQPLLGRLAGRYTADVDELVTWTWHVALCGLDTFRWRSPFAVWVAGICVEGGRTRARSQARNALGATAAPTETGDTWADLPWGARWPSSVWAAAEQALASMPLAAAEVVCAHDIDGWDCRHTCDVLGLTDARHRALLDAGRSELRDHLAVTLDAGAVPCLQRGDGDVPVAHPTPGAPQIEATARFARLLDPPAPTAVPASASAAFRRWQPSRRRGGLRVFRRSGESTRTSRSPPRRRR